MSYQVYDENGYVGDFATTRGLNDFMGWCRSTNDEDLIEFAKEGMYIYPLALYETLVDYEPPAGDLKKTYDNFMSLLPKCKGIVIISDGANDDLAEEGE